MPILSRPAEERARAISYLLGIAWALAFLLFVPTYYASLIDLTLIHLWAVLAMLGCVMGLVGTLTRIDLKLELPGIYLVQVGMLLYFTAQFGFFMPSASMSFTDRIGGAIYIVWHSSMMWPRWWGLNAERARIRMAARAAKVAGEQS